jgi:hypothetical protein
MGASVFKFLRGSLSLRQCCIATLHLPPRLLTSPFRRALADASHERPSPRQPESPTKLYLTTHVSIPKRGPRRALEPARVRDGECGRQEEAGRDFETTEQHKVQSSSAIRGRMKPACHPLHNLNSPSPPDVSNCQNNLHAANIPDNPNKSKLQDIPANHAESELDSLLFGQSHC